MRKNNNIQNESKKYAQKYKEKQSKNNKKII
jgi:hypothetical protein